MRTEYNTIEKIIRDAGKIMLLADRKKLNISEKEGSANFVTEYDVKVQEYLITELGKVIPNSKFLAEEKKNDNELGEGSTFIVDPIDGTANFMFDRHASGISVALAVESQVIYGAVYDPYSDRFYCAIKGEGAFCNGKNISVSKRIPENGVASVGTSPYYKDSLIDSVTQMMRDALMKFGDIRRIGSAALELCAVACGETDAFFEPVLSPWDYAAGMLIVKEAGGVLTNFSGDEPDVSKPSSVVAASKKSYKTAFEIVKDKF